MTETNPFNLTDFNFDDFTFIYGKREVKVKLWKLKC